MSLVGLAWSDLKYFPLFTFYSVLRFSGAWAKQYIRRYLFPFFLERERERERIVFLYTIQYPRFLCASLRIIAQDSETICDLSVESRKLGVWIRR